jgi:predicted DNA-binding transcriptional regulator AlpA
MSSEQALFLPVQSKQNRQISEEIIRENEEMDIVSISSSSMYDVVDQLM